jgi:NitT/TauT family transport system ATP-binding protein
VFAFAKTLGAATPVQRELGVDAVRAARPGASVSIESVSYEVGALRILDDVSLSVSAGEFLCVLGPSGSGKSTILNLLAGLLRPTRGRIVCGDREVTSPSPERALVFQDAALFPWLTVRGNVEFALRLQGLDARARAARSEELLRLVHLWRFRESYPHELSGGMRQRGGIARALASDPAVLLMDEPFAALDAQTREILQAEVERIWAATRKTVIFITHNVREAVRLADRVVLMGTRPGRIIHEARVDLPRPRDANDVGVTRLVADLGARIATEVETVAKEEGDDAWLLPRGRVPRGARRDLGRSV